nr:MAG TPA: gamma delta Resolvase, site specific recombination [Caudoviricetes sp.]
MTKIQTFSGRRSNAQDVNRFSKKNERSSGEPASAEKVSKDAEREGDTLVVWKLDRLGRSMRNLVLLVDELRQRGNHFKSLTDSIDTSSPMGRFIFHIM